MKLSIIYSDTRVDLICERHQVLDAFMTVLTVADPYPRVVALHPDHTRAVQQALARFVPRHGHVALIALSDYGVGIAQAAIVLSDETTIVVGTTTTTCWTTSFSSADGALSQVSTWLVQCWLSIPDDDVQDGGE